MDWLETRYLVDTRSRNQKILREFIDRISEFDEVSIIDIGSGIGSNFRYLVERIDQDQDWIFVDQNERLMKHSEVYLKEKLHIDFTIGKKFERDDKEITIETQVLDILTAKFLEIKANCIVANAVFDLLSKSQFEHFIGSLSIPLLYFTINYNGMKFNPMTEEDQIYIDLYNQHMERDQVFGNAMASKCSSIMVDVLNDNNYDTIIGPSDWILNNKDIKVQLGILDFMKNSILEIINSEEEMNNFRKWLDNKKARIRNNDFQMIIQHDDILAIKSQPEDHNTIE